MFCPACGGPNIQHMFPDVLDSDQIVVEGEAARVTELECLDCGATLRIELELEDDIDPDEVDDGDPF